MLQRLAAQVGDDLVTEISSADQSNEAGISSAAPAGRRPAAETGRASIRRSRGRLEQLADYLVHKSVWLVGGDGWAYDIGFGGLDHVLSMRHNINILVLDTEVYSNTGGQASKSTPLGAAAKFAASGKAVHKKDLGPDGDELRPRLRGFGRLRRQGQHTVQAFQEAESYDGPSLIIAYSHCIAHGYDLRFGAEQQKLAVNSGIWPLYRFDPRRIERGEPPLVIDAPAGRNTVEEYRRNEARFRMVEKIDPARFRQLARAAQAAGRAAGRSLRATGPHHRTAS